MAGRAVTGGGSRHTCTLSLTSAQSVLGDQCSSVHMLHTNHSYILCIVVHFLYGFYLNFVGCG